MQQMDGPRTRYCSRCLTTFTESFDRCPNLGCRCHEPEAGWGLLLDTGDVLDRHYRIDKLLAIGGAGVTYLARELGENDEPEGPALAIKVLYAQRDQGSYLRRLATEANILLDLSHPNIVHIAGFVQRAGHSPYLVTRFEDGGSLLDQLRRVGRMKPREVAAMGVQLCSALEMAHQRGVIHRDLKPENILLAAEVGAGEIPQTRLTDFGIAKVYGGVGSRLTRVGAFVGTPQYAAPEQFEGISPTPAADVYSLAAVLLFCVTFRAILKDIDLGDPAAVLEELKELLPPNCELEGEDPLVLEGFNHFLRATMGYESGNRVSIGEARRMLDCVAEGRGIPLPSRSTVLPESFTGPHAVADGVKTSDTFEGLLSTDEASKELKNRPLPTPTEDSTPTDVGGTLDALDGVDEADPPPKRGGLLRAAMGLLLLCSMVVLAVGAAVHLGYVPMPGETAPVVLGADDPEHAALIEQIAGKREALSACGEGIVRFHVTIGPDGHVAEIGKLEASDTELAHCARRELLGEHFERSTDRAVKVAAELTL